MTTHGITRCTERSWLNRRQPMKALICVFPLVKRTVENVRTFCLHGINWIFGVCQNVEAKRQQTENVNIHRDTTRHTDDADSRAHSRANFTYGCTESDISENQLTENSRTHISSRTSSCCRTDEAACRPKPTQ